MCDLVSAHLLHILTGPTFGPEYGAMMALSQGLCARSANATGGSSDKLEPLVSRNNSAIKIGALRTSGGPLGTLGGGAADSPADSPHSFNYTQSRSFTGALITGLTEKLNQKRIKSSMDWPATSSLHDLQIISLLGEGGFAKVFRGRWRGLVVGIKVRDVMVAGRQATRPPTGGPPRTAHTQSKPHTTH